MLAWLVFGWGPLRLQLAFFFVWPLAVQSGRGLMECLRPHCHNQPTHTHTPSRPYTLPPSLSLSHREHPMSRHTHTHTHTHTQPLPPRTFTTLMVQMGVPWSCLVLGPSPHSPYSGDQEGERTALRLLHAPWGEGSRGQMSGGMEGWRERGGRKEEGREGWRDGERGGEVIGGERAQNAAT